MIPNTTETTGGDSNANSLEDQWLIRDYNVYEEEYNDCVSIKGRFHQYFVYGKPVDCTPWKRDANNCYKWEQAKDYNAAKQLIASEKLRRKQRLNAHYGNTTWTQRNSPPNEWNKPLPDGMQQEYENTYLNIKNKEMNGEIPPQFDIQPPRLTCNIM